MPTPVHARAKLPSGGEFSPNQIELRAVLQIASTYPGNRSAAGEAIRSKYYASAAASRRDPVDQREQQRKRAGNVLIGMQTYGLYAGGSLTEIGRELLNTRNDAALHTQFAQYILRECHGFTVLQAIRNVQTRGERPTKGALAAELQQLGIEPPRATTHHLILIAWLRQAGVFTGTEGYEINEARASALVGIALPTANEWGSLSNQQRAVLNTLKALSLVHGQAPLSAQTVIEHVEREYGRIFGSARDQLRRQVFRPLERGGWVAMSLSSGGRGGKSGTIAATRKLLDLDLAALPAAVASDIPADLRSKLTTPLEQIYRDLGSPDAHVKGIALELLALRIATDLNITPRQLRLRGTATAGAEVDLIAEGSHLHFSRWLFQCKNTRALTVADLAKEVGMAVLLRSHVIVMVTTGNIGATVRSHARTLAEATPHQAVLVDGMVLSDYRKKGAPALLEYFHGIAAETLQFKRSQVSDGKL